jgi:hypothetical protein
LLIDAKPAARARPVSAPEPQAEIGTDSGFDEVLDRQLVSAALQHLSPAHQSVLVETFYRGGTKRSDRTTQATYTGIPCTPTSLIPPPARPTVITST